MEKVCSATVAATGNQCRIAKEKDSKYCYIHKALFLDKKEEDHELRVIEMRGERDIKFVEYQYEQKIKCATTDEKRAELQKEMELEIEYQQKKRDWEMFKHFLARDERNFRMRTEKHNEA